MIWAVKNFTGGLRYLHDCVAEAVVVKVEVKVQRYQFFLDGLGLGFVGNLIDNGKGNALLCVVGLRLAGIRCDLQGLDHRESVKALLRSLYDWVAHRAHLKMRTVLVG